MDDDDVVFLEEKNYQLVNGHECLLSICKNHNGQFSDANGP